MEQATLIEALRKASLGTLVERMGIDLVEVTKERVVATMPVAGNTQPYGLLHGGANVVLAETLGSIGAMLNAGPGRAAVGIEVSATHHRAVSSGTVTGVATPVHLGGTVMTWDITISDEQQRRMCTARLTCIARDAPPAPASVAFSVGPNHETGPYDGTGPNDG